MQLKPSRVIQLSFALVCLSVLMPSPVSTIATTGKLQDGKSAAAYNAKGLELYAAGKYEDAIDAYQQAIKLKEDYADAHSNLGDAYFQLNEFRKAVEAYKKAVRYQPGLGTGYDKIGTAYFRLGEHNKAIAAYKEAIRLEPKAATYYNLAATYIERGDQKAALDQYRILKTVDPELAKDLYGLIYKVMASVFSNSRVSLNVMAIDSQGSPLRDLKPEDFQVFQDGVPQHISFFSNDQIPLVYGLALDKSGSYRVAFPLAIETCRAVIKSNLPDDQTLLVSFVNSDKIETVQDFTSDQNALTDVLDGLFVENGSSAILDAVYLAAQRVAQYKSMNGRYLRRAVILVTDGDERSSYYTMEDVLKLLRKIDVQVFAVSLAKESYKGPTLNQRPVKGAVDLLTTLANESGGQAFFPKSVSELETVTKQMMNMIRSQYVIAYEPANAVLAETYRRVNVTIVDKPGGYKRSAMTRAGYLASEK